MIVLQVLLHGAVHIWKESNSTIKVAKQLIPMATRQEQRIQTLHLDMEGVLWVSGEMPDGSLIPWDSLQLKSLSQARFLIKTTQIFNPLAWLLGIISSIIQKILS